MVERFGGICLITPDVLRLSAFYAALLQRAPLESDAEFAEFRIGAVSLAMFSLEGMERLAAGSTDHAGCGRCTLDLEVDDVDAAFDRMRGMEVTVVKAPMTHPWGRRSFWLRDPDGNIVNLYRETGGTSKKALVREYFDRIFNQRDLSVIEERLAADYRDHDAPEDAPRGPAPVRSYVQQLLEDYPDMAVRIEDLLEDGCKVAARIVWSGTHRSGAPRYGCTGNLILEFDEEGRFSQRWSAYRE